jgi:nitroimidazol reductase NimA-like FMN-containing flavoprotein (pyridoxamine 5'-phosphate oxidase superfamily)
MKELTSREMTDLMNRVGDGILALTDGKTPYCIPFGFVFVENHVYLSMFPSGRKWGYFQKNPNVCFTVFCWNNEHTEWYSVVIDGEMEQVQDIETIERVVKANIEKVGLDAATYLEKRLAYYKKSLDNPKALKIFKIKTKEMRGRKMATQIGS